MLMLIKVVGLFLGIFVITPVVFFALIACFGNFFALTIDRSSWVARTKIVWVRKIFQRFIA